MLSPRPRQPCLLDPHMWMSPATLMAALWFRPAAMDVILGTADEILTYTHQAMAGTAQAIWQKLVGIYPAEILTAPCLQLLQYASGAILLTHPSSNVDIARCAERTGKSVLAKKGALTCPMAAARWDPGPSQTAACAWRAARQGLPSETARPQARPAARSARSPTHTPRRGSPAPGCASLLLLRPQCAPPCSIIRNTLSD